MRAQWPSGILPPVSDLKLSPVARITVLDLVVLGLALVTYAALSLYQLELPGLYYDEAADAVPAMQLLLGQPLEPVREAAIWVGDIGLPLMVMDYVGAINTYLLLPFFALLGVEVFALRLAMVAVGGLTIVLCYGLGRELFGPDGSGAALAALLLAVHPSFVFFSRQGSHVTSITAALAVASLCCLLRWHRGKGNGHLYLGALLLGLGLWAKVLFLWFIVAALGVYLIARRFGSTGTPIRWDKGIVAVVAFLLGAWPLLLYNVETGGTLEVLRHYSIISQYGVNNLAILTNLGARLDSLRTLLVGDYFWFLGGPFAFEPYWPTFGALVVLGLILALRRGTAPRGPSFVLMLAFVALVIIQSCFTLSGLWATHLYPLVPFLAILAGASLSLLRESLRPAALGYVLAAGITIALLLGSLGVDLRYHQALTRTGGLATHSDAIYHLSAYLDQQGGAEPVALDWGIKYSVQLSTQGRVNPVEIFGYESEPSLAFYHRLYRYLVDPDRLYLLHASGFEVFPYGEAFLSLAGRLGKEAVLQQAIAQRDGTPIYQVYFVRDAVR